MSMYAKDELGNNTLASFTVASGNTDNDVGIDSRIFAAADVPQSQQFQTITNFCLTLDGGSTQRDTLAGTVAFYTGTYGAATTPSADYTLVASYPFGAGTLAIFQTEQMRDIRSARGEELFCVVTFDDATTDDVTVRLACNWRVRH